MLHSLEGVLSQTLIFWFWFSTSNAKSPLSAECNINQHEIFLTHYVWWFFRILVHSLLFSVETNAADTYPIQPLAGHLDSQQTNANMSVKQSHIQPTNASFPPLSQSNQPQSGQGPPPPQSSASAGSNPYRIGTGFGSKKPAYGVSGIASFGPTTYTSSQPMMAPNPPVPQPSVPAFSQVLPLSNTGFYL